MKMIGVSFLWVGMDSSIRFFFFQAEDGIRDDLVTGVQTCALPISLKSAEKPDAKMKIQADLDSARKELAKIKQKASDSVNRKRSEERRVGKECRSRWSPDH